MRKKSLTKLISKISEGIFDKAVDLLLFSIYYFVEMGPLTGGNLYQKFSRIDKDFQKFNSNTLKRAVRTAQEKGWLSADVKVTTKGQKRLEATLPKYEKKAKWNGNWYIAAYDIPEDKKWLREILRDNLKNLGFGQLHKSIFVCPYNFLGDVEKIVNQYKLSSFVLLAVSNKLGREPSRDLAERVWHLQELDADYEKYITDFRSKKLSRKEAIFRYLVILERDPQLPQDLLPYDWKGKEAYKIYRKLVLREKLGLKK